MSSCLSSFAILKCNDFFFYRLIPFCVFLKTVIGSLFGGSKNLSSVQNLELEAIFQGNVSLLEPVFDYRK